LQFVIEGGQRQTGYVAPALSMGLNSRCYITLSLQDNDSALNPERVAYYRPVVSTLDYRINFSPPISCVHLLT
ncbi:MAG: hypothetical protein AAFY70_04870, partial [Bacteroidota bacterium]